MKPLMDRYLDNMHIVLPEDLIMQILPFESIDLNNSVLSMSIVADSREKMNHIFECEFCVKIEPE